MSHLSDDEDEELIARAEKSKQKKASKLKPQTEEAQGKASPECMVVKLKNLPSSVSRVSSVIVIINTNAQCRHGSCTRGGHPCFGLDVSHRL